MKYQPIGRLDVDLAEHVPGTPDRYKHGWIPVDGVDPEAAKRAAARDKVRRSLVRHSVKAEHVVDMWNQANPDEKLEGENWYQSAHDVTEGMAHKYGLTMHQAAGVVAVYSPQTGWGTNLIRAATVMRHRKGIGGKGSGVMATDKQRQAADRIMAGEDYDKVIPGLKINNFAHLIENGGDETGREKGRVVMDRHAIGVARGVSMTEDQYTIDRPASVKRYEMMSDAYRKAAKIISAKEGREIKPHQVQAATWLARQRLNRTANRGKARNTRGVNDWNAWQEYADQAGLDDGDAGTGYELSWQMDFAEHVPGTPDRYRHGWIPVTSTEDYDEFSVPVDSLRSRQLRPDSQVDELVDSIKKNGFDPSRPLTFYAGERDSFVMDGNHRLIAARKAGLTHVPLRVYKNGDAEDRAVGSDTKAAGNFYKAEIAARKRQAEEDAYFESDEYKNKVEAARRKRKADQKKWLVDAAARLRKEGKTKLAAEAQSEADAINLAQPQDAVAVQQTPPEQDDTLKDVVEVLLAAYAVDKTAKLLMAIVPGITLDVWRAALHSTNNAAKARPLISRFELKDTPGEPIAKAAAQREIYYRAAYVLRAAERIQADMNTGSSLGEALVDEKAALKMHQAARNNRMNAAGRAASAAVTFGTLLGWYLNPALDNEPECEAADGNNFDAVEGTVIGYPGAVHLNCGCTAGPPIAGAGMVNDAIERAHNVIFQTPRRYGLKAVS